MIIILIQLLVPLALCLAVALQRAPNAIQFILGVLAMGMTLFFMWLVFRWDLTSVYLRVILPLLFLLAIILGYRRVGTAKKKMPGWQLILNTVINLFLIIMMSGLSWVSVKGYPAPDGAIKLSSPLREGRFVVLNGGASPFINGHFKIAPQNHALDILGLNAMGARAAPFGDLRELESYAIYGASIYAPCEGRVVSSVDGLKDLRPGSTDRENLAGNHVLLECGDTEVVLAHMQRGSVQVAAGQWVDTETQLGAVGNSGNTSEPHLHIHAERGGQAGVLLNGRAVPMLIGGRYLVRGDIIGPGD